MKIVKILLLITISILMAGCGGGGGVCGSEFQIFSISFPYTNYSGRVGIPFKIIPTVNPESCRGSMNIQIGSGSMPPGLSISSGEITGTPSRAGSYTFNLGIAVVDGYEKFSNYPSSNFITITISN